MGARGAEPTEGRKISGNLSKLVMLNLITFQKLHEFLHGVRQKYKNN